MVFIRCDSNSGENHDVVDCGGEHVDAAAINPDCRAGARQLRRPGRECGCETVAEGVRVTPDMQKMMTTFAAGPQRGSGGIERFACVEDDG